MCTARSPTLVWSASAVRNPQGGPSMSDDGRLDGVAGEPRVRSGLAGTRFLAAFEGAEERFAVEALAQPPREVRAGGDIVREGEVVDRLYLVTEGWAYRYKTTRNGTRQIVALLIPGDLANLDTLMLSRADFGARTLTAAKVVAISCDDMLTLATYHAGIGKTLTRLATVENSILSQWALCLGRMSAQQRLAHLLCELGERISPNQAHNSFSFNLPLTQEQLADTLGLTSVHVNRMLQGLRSEGLIESAARTMTFPDISRLRDAADFDAGYLHGGRANGFRPWPEPA